MYKFTGCAFEGGITSECVWVCVCLCVSRREFQTWHMLDTVCSWTRCSLMLSLIWLPPCLLSRCCFSSPVSFQISACAYLRVYVGSFKDVPLQTVCYPRTLNNSFGILWKVQFIPQFRNAWDMFLLIRGIVCMCLYCQPSKNMLMHYCLFYTCVSKFNFTYTGLIWGTIKGSDVCLLIAHIDNYI